MVTDFCPGGDIRSLISQHRLATGHNYLPEDHARVYLAEILIAIEDLHKNGIVHRDIKPENVLIDQKGHALLSDFGLAKEGLFEQKMTDTMLGGGQSYQIPEVLLGKKYGKSVDLFLYGALAFEMMTGEQAFPFLNDEEEHNERIKTCVFHFPDEPGYKDLYKKMNIPLPSVERNAKITDDIN